MAAQGSIHAEFAENAEVVFVSASYGKSSWKSKLFAPKRKRFGTSQRPVLSGLQIIFLGSQNSP